MKPRIIIYLLVFLLIGLLVYHKITAPKQDSVSQNPGKPSGPSLVNAVIIKARKLDNDIAASGSVLANEEAELRSEINGKITGIFFHEGSKVSKGELLVKINDADLQAQLHKSQLMLQLAQDKVNREKKLLSINGISQEEYDQNVNAMTTTQADIELLKAQIAKTEIHAPFSGVVGLKNISEGNFVTPTTLIAAIQQLEPVKIDFSVPEKYEGMFIVGSPSFFAIQGSDKQYNAKIYAIEPKVDMATRTIKVRALCDNKDGTVLPGAFVEVHLPLKEIGNAIMVPTEAIIPILKGEKVYISHGDSAVSKKIKAGIRTDTQVQVLEGIKEGDTVIVTGIMGLKSGSKLKFLSIKKED